MPVTLLSVKMAESTGDPRAAELRQQYEAEQRIRANDERDRQMYEIGQLNIQRTQQGMPPLTGQQIGQLQEGRYAAAGLPSPASSQPYDLAIARQEGERAGLVENALRPFQRSRLGMSQALMTGYNEEDMTAAQRAGEILAAESQASRGPGEFVGGITQMLPMVASAGTLAAPSLVGRVIPGLARAPGLVAGLGEGLATAPMAAEGIAAANESGASIPAALGAGTAEAIGYSLVPRVVPKILPSAAPSMAPTVGRQMADFLKAAPREALQTGVGMGGAQAVAETGKAAVGLADPGVAEMLEQQGGLQGAVERTGTAAAQGGLLGPGFRALQLPGQIRDAQDAQFNRQMADVTARADKDMADLAAVDAARAKQAAAEQDVADRQAAFEDIVQRSEPAYAASLEAQRQDLAARGRFKRQQAAAKREAEMAAAEANRVRMEREMPPLPEAEVAARREQAAELVPRPPPARVEPMGPEMPPVAGARPAPEPARSEAPAPTPSPEAPASPMRPEMAPAEATPAAEQAPVARPEIARPLPVEHQQALQRVGDHLRKVLKDSATVEDHPEGLIVKAPGSEIAVRIPRSQEDVVSVFMDPRNDRSIVASLANRPGGTNLGRASDARAVHLTNDASGLALYQRLPEAKRRDLIRGLVRSGDLGAYTVTNPRTGDSAPLSRAAHVYIVNPEVRPEILAHEIQAHVALVTATPAARVVEVAKALHDRGLIQSADPNAANYVAPGDLANPAALRRNGNFEEAFGYAYQEYFGSRAAREVKSARSQIETGRLGRVFKGIRDWFAKLLRIRKSAEEVDDLDRIFSERYEGKVFDEPIQRERVAGKTDILYEREQATLRKEQEAEAKRGEQNIRREEAEMGRQREADLAAPKMDAATRAREIADDILDQTRVLNRAKEEGDDAAAAQAARAIRELRAERESVRAKLGETKTKAEAEDARAIVEPPPEEGVRPAFNKAQQAQTKTGREMEADINEREAPVKRTLSQDEQAGEALLNDFIRDSGDNRDVGYGKFIDNMRDSALQTNAPSMSGGQVAAIRQVLNYWDNRLALATKSKNKAEIAKAERGLEDAVITKNLYGTELGRALASYVDRLQTPQERVSFLREMLRNPSKAQANEIRRLYKTGDSAKARARSIEVAKAAYEKAKKRYEEEFGQSIDDILANDAMFEGDEGIRPAFIVARRIAAITDPPSGWALMKALYQNNLLTPTGQAIVNNVGNAMFAGTTLAKRFVTNPAEAAVMTKAMMQAIPRAATSAIWSFKHGASKLEAETIGSLRRAGGKDAQAWRDPVMEPVGTAAKLVSAATGFGLSRRLGIFGDEFMSTLWYHASLTAQARKAAKERGLDSGSAEYADFIDNAVKRPSPEMKEEAGRTAADLTFRLESEGGLADINKIRQRDDVIGFGATIALPFFNTLVQLTKKGWEHSPVGAPIVSGMDLMRYFAAKKRGDPTRLGGVVEAAIGRMLVAGMIYGAAEYGGEDFLAGSGTPYKQDPAAATREQRSGRARSMRLGDYDVNIGTLQPLSLPLLQSADIRDAIKGKIGFGEFLSRQLGNAIGDQYFEGLAQLGNVMTQREDPERWATNVASGFVPGRGIARDVDRAFTDNQVMESRSTEASEQPWWRQVLRTGSPTIADLTGDEREVKRDIYGRTKQRGVVFAKGEPEDMRAWDGWFGKAEAALKTAREEADKAGNVALANRLKGISEPGLHKPVISGRKLTEEQYAEAKRIAGEAFAEFLRSMNPETTSPTPQALKRISEQYGKLWERAAKQAIRGLPGRMAE